ncbi:S-adenosyl-L-methionine-dependent methyltransferase [Gyrodon lividus]|nr:S-adenosyl-L-methionine-dependent methyltransferase [Gyrodon lividus]
MEGPQGPQTRVYEGACAIKISATAASAKAEVARLLQENPDNGWDNAWKAGVTPWDAGDVQPALRNLILSKELDLPKQGRALGYDATFIASNLGLDALAIDISPTAVQAAQVFANGKASFKEADFFKLSASEEQKISLIYDHTFFEKLGRQISALLKRGGYLITLVYPLDLPLAGGPPFHVKPEHYVDVLGEGWVKVLDKVPGKSTPTHMGRERLVVYRKL